MKTIVVGARPPELDALIERRRALGLDGRDELWDGEYHMNPSPHSRHAVLAVQLIGIIGALAPETGLIGGTEFNLGETGNFRVPDSGWFRSRPDELYVPTAAIVVEILSPDDETYEKFPHYAAHGVEELVVVDPDRQVVEWYRLAGGGYERTDHSGVLDVDVADIDHQIDW